MDTSIRDPFGIPLSDMLRMHGMPPEEIHAILEARDPEIVRRYLALHRERLQEGFDERLRALEVLEELLVGQGKDEPRLELTRIPYDTRQEVMPCGSMHSNTLSGFCWF